MPICPECDCSEAEFFRSKWTNRPVYRDAKVMAKCRHCGNVFIVFDKYLETHTGIPTRKRWWRLITYTAASAFGVAAYWFDVFENVLSTRTALIIAIVFGALAIVEVVLWRTLALGRHPVWDEYSENVQAVVILIALGFLVMIAYGISRCIAPV
ncbi:MAG: hypothetical protein H6818_22260 [Phycisphaerales bacterium]|nr:hypothetical protein [Phycisphaerales bacterium]